MKMTKQKQEQVFGTIEKFEKNKDYQGKETKTAKVTVDNINREISVDVTFKGMLGTTSETAYPGNQGLRNRELVHTALNEIAAEETRAKQSEKLLNELIQQAADEHDVESLYLERLTKEETKRATESEQALKEQIDAVDAAIRCDLQTTKESLLKEDLLIKQEIADLATAVESADNIIIDLVNSAVADLSETDKQLHNDLDTVKSDYAKKSDIPDVSAFIAEIPQEYITESELTEKGYVSSEDIIKFLNSIKFIDGGTSSSLNI